MTIAAFKCNDLRSVIDVHGKECRGGGKKFEFDLGEYSHTTSAVVVGHGSAWVVPSDRGGNFMG